MNNISKKRDGPSGRIRWTGKEFIFVNIQQQHPSPYIATSPDGKEWTVRYEPPDSSGQRLHDLAWNNEVFVAVGIHNIVISPRENTGTSKKEITKKNNNNINLLTYENRITAFIPAFLNNKRISVAIFNVSGKMLLNHNSFVTDRHIECSILNLAPGRYNFVVNSERLHFVKIDRDEEAINYLRLTVLKSIAKRNEILQQFNTGIRYPKELDEYWGG